jgi:hypothetical protein
MASANIQVNPGAAVIPPQLNPPPSIFASRRQLDDRMPILGFNIYFSRQGYGEVLLSTDRSLFDPVNAGRRNPSNFYSSRQDSRLIPIQFGTAVYVVPAAVLRGFAKAVPRPSEIFYTLAVYASQEGGTAEFAQAPETLKSSAPSVALSPHFGSDGVHEVLGMNPDRLRRYQPAMAQSWSFGVERISRDEDLADGEDGTTAPPPQATAPAQLRSTPLAADVYDPPHDSADSRYDLASAVESMAGESGDHDGRRGGTYDDGYEGETPRRSDWISAAAQQVSFRPGDPEPAVLEDEDVSDDRYPTRRVAQSASLAATLSHDDDDDDDGGEGYGGHRNGDGRATNYVSRSSAAVADYDGDSDDSPGAYRVTAAAAAYGDEADQYRESEPPYQSLSSPGPVSGAGAIAPSNSRGPELNIEAKRDLIGKLGDYSAVSADAEFNGVLGPGHPAYRKYHLGLSFGVAMFNQDAGHLGQLLTAMRQRDAARFNQVFGPDAEALLQVTNAAGPSSAESANGRSPRVQKVSNKDLWEEPWLSRFREAGTFKPFQSIQNQLAAAFFLDPMIQFARWMALDTERGLAILMDRAAQLGVQPAQQWVANAAGPLQTPPQRHQALAALGIDTIRAFQSSRPGTETNGQWGPLTHAAAVAALRARGGSPVPLPTTDQMLDALVRRSAQTPWSARLIALRSDVRLGDTPFHASQE